MDDKRGRIIVIEGTDCSGKETQSKRLIAKLNEEGYKTKLISFPNYDTPTGKIVGGPYLGKKEICPSYFKEGATNLDPRIASLYYAADRLYSMKEVDELLNQGYVVVLDRYVTSNLAHQGGKITDEKERLKLYKWIDDFEYGFLHLPQPDKTIFLRVPFEVSRELLKNREDLDEHEKSEEHLRSAEHSYLELTDLYGWDRIECMDGARLRSIEEIADEVYSHVEPTIKHLKDCKRRTYSN